LPIRLALLFWGGAIKRPIAMNDFPSPAFIGVAGLLALLLLAIRPALDGRVGDRCRVDRPLGGEATVACGRASRPLRHDPRGR
jgi:hypothetical protein